MNSYYFNNLSKQKLHGRWNKAALCYLIYTLIIGVINGIGAGTTISNPFFAVVYVIGIIATIIISGPLYFGFVRILSRISNSEDFDVAELFCGFKECFGKSITLYIVKNIYIFLWSLLFVIPGIIKSYGYRLAFYLLHDDPNMNSDAAIKLSDQIMKGNKWRLFCLDFSYIGWFLLSILTFGILLFWVIPKHELAVFEFYKELTAVEETENVDSDLSSKGSDNPYNGDFVV